MSAAGYRWEDISNWALPGHGCRHNRLYWGQGDYRGIGSAAHSHRAGRRWWNVRTPDRYVAAVDAGREPVAGERGAHPRTPGDSSGWGWHCAHRPGCRAAALPDDPALERAGGAGRDGPCSPSGAGCWPRRWAGGRSRSGRPGPGRRRPTGGPVRCLPMPDRRCRRRRARAAGDLMEKVVSLCKRRGLIFPSAEIYGGFRSTYDYGPLGRQPPAQRQERLVGGDGPAPRRRRRPRRRHPAAAGGLGGLRPPGQLHRPAGRLPLVPSAVAGRPHRRGLPELRIDGAHRGPGVQPHVQDARRPGRGRGCRRLPAAGDGPGHVRQLRQRAPDHPEAAPVRHRPGRQVVPQRDHAPELRVPHPRVRADGDGVLRTAGGGARRGSTTGWPNASAGTSTSASPRIGCACATTTPTSCPTTRRPPPTSSSSSRGDGTSSRASPTAPTST